MRRIKWLVPVLAIALLVGMAPDAQAQVEKPWSIELGGGVFIPLSPDAWKDVVGSSAGVGILVGYQLTPAFYILATGGWGFMTGSTVDNIQLPDGDLYAYFINGGYDFTAGKSVSVMAQLGVGANTFKSDLQGAESSTDFAANGGLRLRYNISPVVGVTLNGIAMVAFSEDDPTWTVPISAGVFFRF